MKPDSRAGRYMQWTRGCIAGLVFSAMTIPLFSQSNSEVREFGLTAGGFTNFPADRNYLKSNIPAVFIAPYFWAGRHEFSLGLVYPVQESNGLFTGDKITPGPGLVAGYKFYVFSIFNRENLFVHYSFQWLRFTGGYDTYLNGVKCHADEKDYYLNNLVGLGYNLFFDKNARLGFFYILDYVISGRGYRSDVSPGEAVYKSSKTVLSNISTQVGFSINLASLKKKGRK